MSYNMRVKYKAYSTICADLKEARSTTNERTAAIAF